MDQLRGAGLWDVHMACRAAGKCEPVWRCVVRRASRSCDVCVFFPQEALSQAKELEGDLLASPAKVRGRPVQEIQSGRLCRTQGTEASPAGLKSVEWEM